MPKLRLDQAPPATLPLRFLLAMPCWGVAGAALLLVDGDTALLTRWYPATLALVHVWTLGILGNAMFGSLLQFLPAAVGVQPRGWQGVPALHALFNLGVLVLVAGLYTQARWPLLTAGVVLPASFLWLGAMTVPGLWAAAGERLLRAGIGLALGFGMLAAVAGGGLALLLGRGIAWPLVAVDAHAGLGVLGWIVLLLATVARVVMPMFQGTGSVPPRVQAIWLAVVTTGLLAAVALHLRHAGDRTLPLAMVAGAASFAFGALWLQRRVPRARHNALFLHWRVGLLALALAALALAAGQGMVAGALGLGVGLPLLVAGMALEIVPFVEWIALRRRVPRGVQLPGVQRLLPDASRRRVLLAQGAAAPLLVAAVLWPMPWLARLAALGQLVAWSVHGYALASALLAGRTFLRRVAQRA
ncbi:hypothetical protein J7I44_16670 [Frateuria sp. MAH-13]|uniref:NnrS family protein n=1 Tax=Frateuria flava TaxID=2821489 RepID=A0ABS4DSA8_9GAMM|nr:hypothetical protein [Frateuria flava]MBP1475934.1 hypothetical protein [Frateuria flava]